MSKKINSERWVGYLSYHRNGFWIIDTYDADGGMRDCHSSDLGEDLFTFACKVLRYYTKLEVIGRYER